MALRRANATANVIEVELPVAVEYADTIARVRRFTVPETVDRWTEVAVAVVSVTAVNEIRSAQPSVEPVVAADECWILIVAPATEPAVMCKCPTPPPVVPASIVSTLPSVDEVEERAASAWSDTP